MMDPRDYGPRLKDCIIQALVGEELGRGCYRTVFALDDSRVIKIEADGRSFSNTHEWSIWEDVAETKWARWFAPCLEIDAFGGALIQARTKPISESEWKKVKEMPNFFADLKRDNFGMLNGHIVCHDYGNHAMFVRALKTARMKKISARDHERC